MSDLLGWMIRPTFISGYATGGPGTQDIYTVPVKRRALILGSTIFNGSGGSGNYRLQLKVSGNYYNLTPSTAIGSQTNNILGVDVPYVAEAGESFSVNFGAGSSNAWLSIIEFDNSSSLLSQKLLGNAIINGNNTLYTVSAGKSSLIINPVYNTFGDGVFFKPTSGWNFYSGTQAATIFANMIPSQGTPTVSNQITNSSVILTSDAFVTGQIAVNGIGLTVGFSSTEPSGYFFNLNLNGTPNASQWAWITAVEV